MIHATAPERQVPHSSEDGKGGASPRASSAKYKYKGLDKQGYLLLAARSRELPAREFTMLWALLQYADGDNEDGRIPFAHCFPSHKTLARDLGRSVTIVRRRLETLRSLGWIRIYATPRGNGSRSTNTYQFIVPGGEIGAEADWMGPEP